MVLLLEQRSRLLKALFLGFLKSSFLEATFLDVPRPTVSVSPFLRTLCLMSTLSEVCETLVKDIKADMKRLDDDQHYQRAPISARCQSLLHKPGGIRNRYNFGGFGSAGGGGAFF